MEKKECTIIGFGKYKEKEEQKDMLRIIIGVESTSENYTGLMIVAVHLDYTRELENNLKDAIKSGEMIKYTTTDNIVSGKTRVNNFIFN